MWQRPLLVVTVLFASVQISVEAEGERQYVYSQPLQGGRWYVGTTSNPSARIAEHRRGEGAEWTRLYPPCGVARVKLASKDKGHARIEEIAEVKRLMREHGVENVRGGSYSERCRGTFHFIRL
jgi:predicted GIY-YIG superfamily endonuclease